MPGDFFSNQPYKYLLFYTKMHNVQYSSTKASNIVCWLNYDIIVLIVFIAKFLTAISSLHAYLPHN